MSTPVILFLKAQVKGYTRRDGVFVRPHHRKGGSAKQAEGQLALFPEPKRPSLTPNPFKGKDPVKDTGDLFEDLPAAEQAAPKKEKKPRKTLDPVETAKKVLEWQQNRPKGSSLTSRAGWISGWAYANGVKVSDAEEDAILAELDKLVKESLASAGKPESEDGITIRPGKGLIKDKFLADVDGDIVPGGPWDTREAARSAAEDYRQRKGERKAEDDRIRKQKDELADRLKSGGDVTEADLRLVNLRPGSSDLRWFIPATADLFGITSRAVRPHIADMIRVGYTDMGVKREFVTPGKALQAVAAGLSGGGTKGKQKEIQDAIRYLGGKYAKTDDIMGLAEFIDQNGFSNSLPDDVYIPVKNAASAINHITKTGRMSAEVGLASRKIKGAAAVKMLAQVAEAGGQGPLQAHIDAFNSIMSGGGKVKKPETRVLLTKPAKPADVTETPEFKRWFKNSVVVDDKGKPLVVYHGTNAEFTEFDPEKRGENTGWDNAKVGFFFIADRRLAEEFAQETARGDRIIDAYLSIQNPLRLTTEDLFNNREQAPTLTEIFFGERIDDPDEALQSINDEIGLGEIGEIFESLGADWAKEIMERDGYDGVISHFGGGHLEYVAFYPEQIKSASNNSGAFDPKSKDMTKALS